MKKYIICILLATSSMMWSSCSKFISVDEPIDQLMARDAFKDDVTATASLTGIYAQMNSYNYQFANVLMSLLGGMAADEIYAAFTSFDDFRYNKLGPSSSYLEQFWSQPYAYIYQANAVLEGLPASTDVTESVKNQLLGEAHFIRAFLYFYLVNLFGDVPLVTDTDVQKNTLLPRTASAEIDGFIVDELIKAQDLMNDAYTGAGRVRPNKKTASALLARVYLYQEQWDKAEIAATEVINDERYKILDALDQVFLKDSEEAIWQLQTVNTSTPGVNTWEGFNIVPFQAGARAYYTFTDQLNAAFEAGDKRHEVWANSYELSGKTYYYPFKYRYRTTSPVQEYSMVMRFAEQYLIRAEARAQQDDLINAIADLNVIRGRAGIDLLPENLGKSAVLDAVAQERRVELFGEWGHRWFDLKRTGKAVEVLSPIKDGFTASDLLFPIPLSAILTNPNLTPND